MGEQGMTKQKRVEEKDGKERNRKWLLRRGMDFVLSDSIART